MGTAGTIGATALGGPVGGMLASGALKSGAIPHTNANIASTPGYQTNATNNIPFNKGGYACYADGGIAHDHSICMKLGGHVGGEAKVEGDSEENDTVPALLSPGELVIPRSVPKTGKAMEEFARHAPIGGTDKKVDLTNFVRNYKRSR